MDRSGGLPGVALPSVADPGLQANPPSSGLGWPSAIRRPATLLPDSNIKITDFLAQRIIDFALLLQFFSRLFTTSDISVIICFIDIKVRKTFDMNKGNAY